jgi:hypothetical protein
MAGRAHRRAQRQPFKSAKNQRGIIPALRRSCSAVRAAVEAACTLEENDMRMRNLDVCMWMMVVLGLAAAPAAADEKPGHQRCKAVHADLVEVRSEVGCKPEHSFCFLGEVDGNHGLRGTTYFKGEQGALFPPSAPTFRSYVGSFEYITPHGTLTMREMGLTDPPTADPESGAVTAYQKIVDASGDFEGATGYLFVSGFNRNQRIETIVTGEICMPGRFE